jgi:hypothetical protein
MKYVITISIFLLITACCKAQIEFNTGFANNGKGNCFGPVFNVAYEIPFSKSRFAIKSQAGAKFLYANNDFIEATIRNTIFEFHQTFSYQVIRKKKYSLKPNLGVNYRFFEYKAKAKPPYNQYPIRNWYIEFRDRSLVISSADNRYEDTYRVNNLGFTLQIQNQFRLNEKLSLLVTPFIEEDYDGIQTVGGCYFGVRYDFK